MAINGKNYRNGRSAKLNPFGSANNSAPNELIDLKRVFSIVKRYKLLILLLAIISTGGAYYLAYHYLLPVYSSQSTVLIQGNTEEFPGGEGIGRIISNSYLNSGTSIQSEIYFIESKELSEEVARLVVSAKTLPDGSMYPVLWADYPEDSTMVSEGTVAGRIRSGLSAEPIEQGSSILSITYESYSPHEAARIVNYSVNAYKEITAEKKQESAKSARVFLESERERIKDELDEAENRLSGFKNTENLVSMDAQASSLVNNESQLLVQQQEYAIQLEATKEGINNYESQLEAIKPGLGEKYSQAAGPTISRYQQEVASLQAQRLLLVSNNPQLKDNPSSEPKLVQIDRKIKDLKDEIGRLTDNLMASSDNTLGLLAGTDGNVTQEIANIRNTLTQLQIQKNQLQAQLKAIDGRLRSNEASLNRVPDNQKQLARMQREVEIWEQLFLSINNQVSEVAVWEQTRSGAGTVIDYAKVASSPVKPQKPLWLAMGFLLGLFIPIGFILMKEAFNDTINSVKEMKNKNYPLLSVIYDHNTLDKKKAEKISKLPYGKNGNISEDLMLYHYGLSPIAESYRSLVSQMLYSNPDNPPETLLITSPGPSEGKTTLTGNMAMALTEVGKRVLIIDCDMRKPGIPRLFGISKEPGIMEILFKDYTPEEAVRSMPVPGLDVLTTGKKQPARPTSVIGSKSFKDLIDQFKTEYDTILFDSPPFGIISDTAPLLQYTDGVIVLSKFQSTKNIALNHTIEQLENNSANILGLVLSSYNPQKSVDDTEVKGMYNSMYSEYYDYHETKINKKKYSHGKFN
jgi:capsular exopolysaccharide synthesis family protein